MEQFIQVTDYANGMRQLVKVDEIRLVSESPAHVLDNAQVELVSDRTLLVRESYVAVSDALSETGTVIEVASDAPSASEPEDDDDDFYPSNADTVSEAVYALREGIAEWKVLAGYPQTMVTDDPVSKACERAERLLAQLD